MVFQGAPGLNWGLRLGLVLPVGLRADTAYIRALPCLRLPCGSILRAGHLGKRGLEAETLWGPSGQGEVLYQALHR